MTLVGADSNDTGARALVTALTAVFFLLTATAGATLTRSRADLAWFGYVTAALSVAALAGTAIAIWGHPGEGEGKGDRDRGVPALAGAHASLLLGPPYRDGSRRIRLLRNATLAMLALLAGLIVYAILSSGGGIDGKVVTIIAILYVLGSLCCPSPDARRGAPRSCDRSRRRMPRRRTCCSAAATPWSTARGHRPSAGLGPGRAAARPGGTPGRADRLRRARGELISRGPPRRYAGASR